MSNTDPDFKLDGFSLWIQGRQFPGDSDYWDGNWLIVRAQMRASGALVEVEGPILHIPELAGFRDQLRKLNETLAGTAELEPIEPELHLTMTVQSLGHIAVRLSITPDHLNQTHTFEFGVDQSYLPSVLSSLDRVLSDYPVVGFTAD
jgi:hypothetical protein